MKQELFALKVWEEKGKKSPFGHNIFVLIVYSVQN